MNYIDAMKQALEALENHLPYRDRSITSQNDDLYCSDCKANLEESHEHKPECSITNLRTAIKAAERQEPIGEVIKATGSLKDIHIIRWMNGYAASEGDKLYTHPAPAAPGYEK